MNTSELVTVALSFAIALFAAWGILIPFWEESKN